MSDFVGVAAILTLVCIQPALYIFLKSVLMINICKKQLNQKACKTPILLGILGAHLLPFFAILGKQPIESITNFFASLSYIVPSCSFNACSHRTIDYILFPPDRFVDHVGVAGYWILIFAPVILESIFWLVYFFYKNRQPKTPWELPITLIATSWLYATAFLSLYLIDMYAPIFVLTSWFGLWIVCQIVKRFCRKK